MPARRTAKRRPRTNPKAGGATRAATPARAARRAKATVPPTPKATRRPAAAAAVRPMLRVALTGGIATGKSYVLAQFRRRGVPCLDADQLTRGVIAAGTEATAAIAGRFGAEVLAADGSIDRQKLAAIVFSDSDARRDLEAIVHPAVYRAIAAGLRAFELIGGYPVGIVDIPLLYETGHGGDFDKVIVTACPPLVQLARLAERGMPVEQARQRLAAQWPTEAKAARADFIVNTDGTFQQTNRQVDRILRALTAQARRGARR